MTGSDKIGSIRIESTAGAPMPLEEADRLARRILTDLADGELPMPQRVIGHRAGDVFLFLEIEVGGQIMGRVHSEAGYMRLLRYARDLRARSRVDA